MAKYSQAFKLEVVQYFLSGFGKKATGHKFQVNPSDVEKWVSIYDMHGEAGLIIEHGKTVFSTAFKHQVVLTMINEGFSSRAAAKHFQLKTPQLLTAWLQQYQRHGIDGLKPKPKGRPKSMPKPKIPRINSSQEDRDKTQEQLLEELAYLRAEVAFLKKRKALIQSQKEQEVVEQQRLQDSYLN